MRVGGAGEIKLVLPASGGKGGKSGGDARIGRAVYGASILWSQTDDGGVEGQRV